MTKLISLTIHHIQTTELEVPDDFNLHLRGEKVLSQLGYEDWVKVAEHRPDDTRLFNAYAEEL